MRECDRLRVLVVMQQGVERDKHLHAVCMCIAHHFREVLYTVTRRLTRTESRSTDIHGVRSCLYGCKCHVFVLSGRK